MKKTSMYIRIISLAVVIAFTITTTCYGYSWNSLRPSAAANVISTAGVASGRHEVKADGPIHKKPLLIRHRFFLKRLAKVLIVTVAVAVIVGVIYSMGGFNWYIALKASTEAGRLITWKVARIDMITGAIIWGVTDIVGLYLTTKPGKKIDKKKALVKLLILAVSGIGGGLLTHMIYNISRTFLGLSKLVLYIAVGVWSFVVSLYYTISQSIANKLTGIREIKTKDEVFKTADVMLLKLILAPVRIYFVLFGLEWVFQVIVTQICDYLMTMPSAYLMDREKPLVSKWLWHRLKNIINKKPPLAPSSPDKGEMEGLNSSVADEMEHHLDGTAEITRSVRETNETITTVTDMILQIQQERLISKILLQAA